MFIVDVVESQQRDGQGSLALREGLKEKGNFSGALANE